jgi:hypothetical protein
VTTTESADPTVIVVQRWKRFGHDRAYVKVDESDLGYRDLKTAQVHCARSEHADVISRATEHMVQRAGPPEYTPKHARPVEDDRPQPVAPEAPEPAADPGAPTRLPDRDLALNPPGAAARAQAVALRNAAPVRTFLSRIAGEKSDERNWRIGADAEAEVARRLQHLGANWRLLHAVPVGENGSDIDHLVIGPAGVFTVNTKHHPDANAWVRGDTFKVNGHHQPYVRNSRFEAARAARLLTASAGFDVEVRAIITVMGVSGGFTVVEQPRDGAVVVVTRKQLVAHLRGLPEALGPASVTRIFDVARHLATWQPKRVGWSEL